MNPEEEREGPVLYEEDKDYNNEIIEIPKSKKTMENNSNFFARPTGHEPGKTKERPKQEPNPDYEPVNRNEIFDHELPENVTKQPEFTTPPVLKPVHHNVMLGLNITHLLMIESKSITSKLLVVYFLCTAVFSIALSGLEVALIFDSKCPENKTKESLKITVLVGVVVAILLKLVTLAYLNLELFNKTPYTNPYNFLVPILWIGIIPCLQLPQIVYDYELCNQRNPLIKLYEVEVPQIAIIAVVIFCLVYQSALYLTRYHELLVGKPYIITRNVFLVLSIIILLPLNILTILLTFTQLPEFLPFFFFENQFFYILCLIMMSWNYSKHVHQWQFIFAAQKDAQFMGIVDNHATN